jgi:cytochrome c biogenesis protein CcmG/thiol:disulfide interchange protein DsbE
VVPGLFVGFLAFGLTRTSSERSLANKQAPEFELPLVGEGTLSSRDLKGRPVVFNFWASWCIPCREEAPTLEAAWQKYKGSGVIVVGVNVQDSSDDAQEFVDEFGMTYPSVRDTDLKLWTQFGVRGLPETFFVDQGYRFVSTGGTAQTGSQGGTKILGAIPPEVLEFEIQSLLRPKPGAEKSSG